jgi:hypothetical protein
VLLFPNLTASVSDTPAWALDPGRFLLPDPDPSPAVGVGSRCVGSDEEAGTLVGSSNV